MNYLIFYDIGPNNIRTRVARRLLAEGFERIQLSVFTGTTKPQDNTLLWNDLCQWLAADPASRLFVIAVTENNLRNMAIIGDYFPDFDYLSGSKHTLFI
ncbi:MAG TPA: CRISPR-associated endonuclease Cas2 [Bacteroidetes bacterium]|nr:CRISPR-associated endonuclease Cas2 [Bacteroidota bacterium]